MEALRRLLVCRLLLYIILRSPRCRSLGRRVHDLGPLVGPQEITFDDLGPLVEALEIIFYDLGPLVGAQKITLDDLGPLVGAQKIISDDLGPLVGAQKIMRGLLELLYLEFIFRGP